MPEVGAIASYFAAQKVLRNLLNSWHLNFQPKSFCDLFTCFSQKIDVQNYLPENHTKLLTSTVKCGIVETGSLMPNLVAYVDGGSHGSPGPSGIGVVIEEAGGEKVRIAKSIGRQDNNVAEYVALLEALQHAVSVKARTLHVYSDSEIVVKQMTGQYACRSPRLYSLNWTCRKLARSLDFSIAHISRELNLEANELANHAVRSRQTV